MTHPTDPPEATPMARSTPGFSSHARGRQAPTSTNGRQRPPRNRQVLNSAAFAAHILKRIAAGERIDPAEVLDAAEGLRLAVLRLVTAKPPRRGSGGKPRAGYPADFDPDITLEELAGLTAVMAAIATTEHLK